MLEILIEFNTLPIIVIVIPINLVNMYSHTPLTIVNLSITHLNLITIPPWDILLEYRPALSNIGLAEVTIHKELLLTSCQFKICHTRTQTIGFPLANNVQLILSDFCLNLESFTVDVVVCGSPVFNELAVPFDCEFIGVKRNPSSCCIVEGQDQFIFILLYNRSIIFPILLINLPEMMIEEYPLRYLGILHGIKLGYFLTIFPITVVNRPISDLYIISKPSSHLTLKVLEAMTNIISFSKLTIHN